MSEPREVHGIPQAALNLLAAVKGLEGFDLQECAEQLMRSVEKNRTIIVIGEGYWGRGRTENEAIRNYKAEGGTLTKYIVYDCPPGSFVNGMGSLVYPNAASLLGLQGVTEVRRKGFKS